MGGIRYYTASDFMRSRIALSHASLLPFDNQLAPVPATGFGNSSALLGSSILFKLNTLVSGANSLEIFSLSRSNVNVKLSSSPYLSSLKRLLSIIFVTYNRSYYYCCIRIQDWTISLPTALSV